MSLAANWRRIREHEVGRPAYFKLTPGLYSLYRTVRGKADGHIHGLCLDAGAGSGAWTFWLKAFARRVIGTDLRPTASCDASADLKKLPFRDASFDSCFCSQVIEHDAQPVLILSELYRLLKPGGTLVLTAPHLSRLHDYPHDYFRFTAAGLRELATAAGFRVEDVTPAGGLISFVKHNINSGALGLAGYFPPARWAAVAWVKMTSPAWFWLDRALDRKAIMPMNYVAVLTKDG